MASCDREELKAQGPKSAREIELEGLKFGALRKRAVAEGIPVRFDHLWHDCPIES